MEMEGAGLGDVCRKGSPQIGCPLDFFKQKKTQRTTEHSGTLTNHVEYTVFPGGCVARWGRYERGRREASAHAQRLESVSRAAAEGSIRQEGPELNWGLLVCLGLVNNPFRLIPHPQEYMAVGQNQWYHVGVSAPPFLVYFSGEWDVHWGYRLLTHGHMRNHGSVPGAGFGHFWLGEVMAQKNGWLFRV